MTETEYRALDAVNWSALKAMRESPKHYRAALDTKRPDTPALAFGRLVHALVLEPWMPAPFIVSPFDSFRTRDAQAWRAQVEAGGLEVVSADTYDRAYNIADAVYANHDAARILDACNGREVPITWVDAKTGLRCKARLDAHGTAAIVDLKTCQSNAARAFGRVVASYGYHLQLEHYAAGFRAAFGRDPDLYVIAVESTAPHSVAVFRIGADVRAVARAELDDLLARVAECRARDEWPDRYEEVQPLPLPSYLLGDDTESVTIVDED